MATAKTQSDSGKAGAHCPPDVHPGLWEKFRKSGKSLSTSTLEYLENPPSQFYESDEEVDEFLQYVRRMRGHTD